MGAEEAMTTFGTFLNIFFPALFIALFLVIFCFSIETKDYLIAGLMIIAIAVTIIGVNSLMRKEEQPVVDIEPSIIYNYCPTCGQLIEVENE